MLRVPTTENKSVSTAPPAIVMECLGCHRGLRLPAAAAGRVVKCPACGGMTPVPAPPPAANDDPEDVLGDLLSQMFHENDDDDDLVAPPMPSTPARKPAAESASKPANTAKSAPKLPPRPTTKTQPAASPTAQAMPKPASAAPPAASGPRAGAARRGEPSFIQHGPPRERQRPFLAVASCSIAGVELRFPESQLADPLFRSSMPERCIITGDHRGVADLTVRPMVFINKDEHGGRRARSVETQYEIPADASYQHQDYINKTGTLEGLTAPFDLPMPYLVSSKLFDVSLQCVSVRSDTHGSYCRVVIPAPATAAEWIANVNGTANEAWHYLQQHANQMSCEAWTRLPHVIRDRINAWCSFAPGEAFMAYARHADNLAKESGLGGLLVTDQRLIYHMFRKMVEFPLDRPLRVRVRRDSNGVHFSAASNGEPLKKLGPINAHEVPLVFEALESAANLTVETSLHEEQANVDEGPDPSTLFAA